MNEENETQLNGKEGTKLSENKRGEKDVVGRGKRGEKTVPTPLRRKILLIFKNLAKILKSVNQGRTNIALPNLQMQMIMLKIINEVSL